MEVFARQVHAAALVDGLGGLAKQASIIGLAIADLAEALGHKEEAALLRKEANNIAEKGAALVLGQSPKHSGEGYLG